MKWYEIIFLTLVALNLVILFISIILSICGFSNWDICMKVTGLLCVPCISGLYVLSHEN